MSSKEKILTILGTRPEIIRLSIIINKLDKKYKNVLVHTGQNYNYELDKIFFKNFNLRKPNYYIGARGSFGNQLSLISRKLENIIKIEKPKKFLVLGDTNSSLGAIIAKRMGVKVYHMEAGNRCFSNKSPEEVNRKIIDHSSDILLPYTTGSAKNLIDEGIQKKNIIITGNPIYEVILYNKNKIDKSNILKTFNEKKNNYFVITLHREENTDDLNKLKSFIDIFNKIASNYNKKLYWPIHPRSLKNIKKIKIKINKNLKLIKPLGFFDFIKLEKNSKFVFTDSGTVQEECAIFKIPCFIIREYTERLETIKAGSGILVDNKKDKILKLLEKYKKEKTQIDNIPEYLIKNVSSKILSIFKNF